MLKGVDEFVKAVLGIYSGRKWLEVQEVNEDLENPRSEQGREMPFLYFKS